MSTSPFAAVSNGPFLLNPNPRSAADTYWNEVAKVANQLYQEYGGAMPLYITSIENTFRQVTGGRVFETDYRHAGMRIVDHTHRMSTPEEIAGEKARLEKQGAEYNALTDKQKQQTILKPSQEQMEAQAALTGAAVRAAMDSSDSQKVPRNHPAKDKTSSD